MQTDKPLTIKFKQKSEGFHGLVPGNGVIVAAAGIGPPFRAVIRALLAAVGFGFFFQPLNRGGMQAPAGIGQRRQLPDQPEGGQQQHHVRQAAVPQRTGELLGGNCRFHVESNSIPVENEIFLLSFHNKQGFNSISKLM